MRNLVAVIFLVFLIGSGACKKENEPTNDQLPDWLQAKITELVPEQNLCKITDVTIIEYKEKRYYHIYCGIWSCMYCQLFDEKGNRPSWENTEWNDFMTNHKDLKTLPACP